MAARRDAGRDDGDHRAAAEAAVTPSPHHEQRRGPLGRRAATDLTVSEAVPNDLTPAANGTGRHPAP